MSFFCGGVSMIVVILVVLAEFIVDVLTVDSVVLGTVKVVVMVVFVIF